MIEQICYQSPKVIESHFLGIWVAHPDLSNFVLWITTLFQTPLVPSSARGICLTTS